jgi:hypothetical protein
MHLVTMISKAAALLVMLSLATHICCAKNHTVDEDLGRALASEEDRKYITYQPQFGLCNQLRALHHAVAIAKVLKRTLVIPDVLDNDGAGPIYKREILFDSENIVKGLNGVLIHDRSEVSCITMESYNRLVTENKAYLPTKVLVLSLPLKQLFPTDFYFNSIGWKLPKIEAKSLTGFQEKHWRVWDQINAEGMSDEDTLAIHSTFGAWMGATLKEDRVWHAATEQLVYQEANWINKNVKKLTDSHELLKVNLKHSINNSTLLLQLISLQDGFMCAHVRRGNFQKACQRYNNEYLSNSSRQWVTSFVEADLACWVDEHIFVDVLDEVKRIVKPRYAKELPILLISNDERFPGMISAADPCYKVITMDMLIDLKSIFQPALPVIEMTLCSKAKVIIANQYSTFSRAIFKKAVWKRKHMNNFSFAWSKSVRNITYYVDSWQNAGPFVNQQHFL